MFTARNSNRMFALLLAAGLSAPALAQPCTAGGTIQAGPILNRTVFRQAAAPLTATGGGVSNSDLYYNGIGGTDQLNKNWCWYRLSTDPREYALDRPHCTGPAAAWAGSVGTETFVYPTFNVNATYQVVDTGVNAGYLIETFVLSTASAAPICLDYFCYTDFKVNGDNADDTATLAAFAINDVRFTDAGSGITDQFYAAAPPYSTVAVTSTAVGSAASIIGMLSDGSVSSPFPYTLTYGPGDAAACFHWNVCIDSTHPATLVAMKAVNTVVTGASSNPNPGLLGGGPTLSTADANGDGRIDVNDAVAFQAAVASGSLGADIDGNGKVDSHDLARWMSDFASAAK